MLYIVNTVLPAHRRRQKNQKQHILITLFTLLTSIEILSFASISIHTNADICLLQSIRAPRPNMQFFDKQTSPTNEVKQSIQKRQTERRNVRFVTLIRSTIYKKQKSRFDVSKAITCNQFYWMERDKQLCLDFFEMSWRNEQHQHNI